MAKIRLSELAQKMKGKIIQGRPTQNFQAFHIDSRLSSPGSLFFALRAARNGHDFITDALGKGAAGAVICQSIPPVQKDIALIRVKDTTRALQQLARQVLEESRCRVVGITGSIGKTTTKEFTSQLLEGKYNVLKSEGNFNNHLGLPLSLLNLTPAHKIAVLEMGMSHRGEIAALTRIAPPDVAVITNIRPVHLEFFKDIEDIASAKKEILNGAKIQGTAVLNADDPLVLDTAKDWTGRKILFGKSEKADIRAKNIQKKGSDGMFFLLCYGKESAEVDLHLLFDSYLDNFLAAAAVAYSLAVPLPHLITRAKSLKPFLMRGIHHRLGNDTHLIDDSYNSNPTALENTLSSLADFPSRRKVAILGDMLELGKRENDFHHQAGQKVVETDWDLLVTVGRRSRHMAEGAMAKGMSESKILSFDDSEEAADRITEFIQEGDLILVKGSRGIKMEKIVNRLLSMGI